jgi:ABC-type glycerol-3-phosphate transport system substrate-binding protein
MFDDPFQAGVIAFFITAAVAGVAVFAISPNLFGTGSNQQPSTVSIWGTLESEDFNTALRGAGIREDELLTVNYKAVQESDLRNQLVNELARNEGPDALLMPHTSLLQLEEFLVSVGAQTYNSRRFRNNFVEGTEIFMRSDGIIALPFAMDPLVMYWNRDMLSQAGFVSPPETWNQLNNYIDQITAIDQAENISRAAIALGTARNITRDTEILSALLLQADNPIVTENESGERVSELMSQSAEAALRQYTQFANPAATTYTWNNNLPQDQQAFTGSQAAMYFDMGSTINEVRERNPNLNFDVARIPQRANGQARTYGRMYGLAMLDRVQQRRGSVFGVLQRLSGSEVSVSLLEDTDLTPVRKQVVSNASPNDAYKSTFLDAAVIARGWLNPDLRQANRVFTDMITDVVSGQSEVSGAVNTASRSLGELLRDQ